MPGNPLLHMVIFALRPNYCYIWENNPIYMQRILLLASICAMLPSALTAAGAHRLQVQLKDGSAIDVSLSDDLRISFNDTHLIALGRYADVSVERSSIASFTHAEGSGVDTPQAEATFSHNGNSVTLSGLIAGQQVSLVSAEGKTVALYTATASEVIIPLVGLPSGIYAVNTTKASFKIMIK